MSNYTQADLDGAVQDAQEALMAYHSAVLERWRTFDAADPEHIRHRRARSAAERAEHQHNLAVRKQVEIEKALHPTTERRGD